MAVICVDLSKYQAGFNFGAYKAGGGLGVILKASEGTTVKDSSYTTFRPQAEAAGLAIATYHFFQTSDATSQADWYLQCASPDQGERMVCDFEKDGTTIANMITFLKRIQAQRPDLQLTVYSGHLIKDQLGSSTNDWLAKNTSLWIAQYTSAAAPSWPKQVWPQWSLWQYSDQNSVPGFSGAVDTNRFNGPDANFLAWMGPAGVAPSPPQPEPGTQPTVAITLSSDRPVNLVVTAGENVTIGDS